MSYDAWEGCYKEFECSFVALLVEAYPEHFKKGWGKA